MGINCLTFGFLDAQKLISIQIKWTFWQDKKKKLYGLIHNNPPKKIES